MGNHSALLTIMVNAAERAGRSLQRMFGAVEKLHIDRKGPADFVSNADRESESIIRESLEKDRPGYGFVLEERGVVEGTDKSHVWHVDPIDGTTNFIHGLPHFAVSIGLVRDGIPVAGVVYNPITYELFVAEKGKGAFLNDRRIRVSKRTELSDALISCGGGHAGSIVRKRVTSEMTAMGEKGAILRRFGSAALDLAYVASGRLDGFWEYALHSWDVVAGLVLVREAGGFVASIDENDDLIPYRSLVCGNDSTFKLLFDCLKKKSD
jgi:myo-inositol-1(or 4)-monophosphatase